MKSIAHNATITGRAAFYRPAGFIVLLNDALYMDAYENDTQQNRKKCCCTINKWQPEF